ncbi:amino acid adenylation domain-containing protein [Kibdelosporangium philippinense]|uniref:Amino acid adenylation domain-containing protein n=1 Tax=Kibdelosporangium philippinense TaxID=211113 RepID=A0ABS8Z4H2_9PSEU|nr:amino acid adenylation domain-containing protein [Kibdelosporangium philippinense]MCE7002302.1 amino acid adenylation domain-containing protein [Kibdelosporangium philippinense]
MRERQEDHQAWQQHLAGAPMVKPVPTDRLPRSPRAIEPLVCAIPLTADMAAVLAKPGGEFATELPLAALATLILRYTGETDLLVGILDKQLTVTRLRLQNSDTLCALRSSTVESIADAERVGAVDGGELLRISTADGATSQAPCHGLIAIRGDGPANDNELRYADLVIVLQNVHGEPKAALVGNATLYERTTIERLANHVGGLMAAFIAGRADEQIGEVPLLNAEERRQILVEWNRTAQPVPPQHVHELIAAVAESTPDAPAVIYEGVTTTFGELDASANRMANHLIVLGTNPGDNVGVFMERCAESLIVQLAIFKAGATAVLLDPEYPTDRLAFMLSDSSAVAVVTKQHLASILPLAEEGCPVVLADAHAITWQARPDFDPRGEITDESVSHVAYTSGSTGVPKAVMLRHGPLRNTMHVLRLECEITAESRGTWLCSPGFGLVEVDCFPVLAAGAAVYIPPPAIAASPEQQRDWLIENQITHTLQLTAMAERLWTLAWPAETPLKSMRIAGERVRAWPPPELPFTVLNVYGSAEANVVATCDLTAMAARLTSDERVARMPPIGRPVANVRTYVLDERLEPVPPNVLGELYISGDSLSRGYLNRPEANRTKFLDNPLADDPYPVLYRSGDVARHWPDGVIEIVGRFDNETKIRGYRVHLGEVESVLAAQPGVRQCAVLAWEDIPAYRRLVAYVEPDPGNPPTVRRLRSELARRLPPYMLPSAYVVDDLPTTANGKIDRAALQPPPRTRPDLETPYLEPTSPLERGIATLLSEVIGIDEIGTLDDFFELGGDSLRAIRLLSGLRDEYGVELTMADLYKSPTLDGIASAVEQARLCDNETIVHDAASRYRPFPLTTPQQLLWRAQGNRQGPADLYEWQRTWLDIDRFVHTWLVLVERHDALRTVVQPDGEQVVLCEGPDPEIVDLRDLGEQEARDRVAAGRADLRGSTHSHTLRVTLLPDDTAEIQLAVSPLTVDPDTVHRILLPQLAAGYEDLSTLAEPGITFRDYAQSSFGRWAENDRADAVTEDTLLIAADPAEPIIVSTEIDIRTYTALLARCDAAAATAEGAIAAALYETLDDTKLSWLPGATGLPLLAVRTFERSAVHKQVADLAGFFSVARPADDRGLPTFAERARATGSRAGRPARAAVLLSVLINTVIHGDVPAEIVRAVWSTGPYGVADVQVVLDDEALRLHWSFPPGTPSEQALALLADHRQRLVRYATDESAWWIGADLFNQAHGIDDVPALRDDR